MADTRKKYTKEFKLEAVRMLEAGTKTGREIEQDLEIGAGQVYRWRKLFVEDGGRAFPGNGKPRDAEAFHLTRGKVFGITHNMRAAGV